MTRRRYWLCASLFLTVWTLMVLAYGSSLGSATEGRAHVAVPLASGAAGGS